jgi:hypothetical protein
MTTALVAEALRLATNLAWWPTSRFDVRQGQLTNGQCHFVQWVDRVGDALLPGLRLYLRLSITYDTTRPLRECQAIIINEVVVADDVFAPYRAEFSSPYEASREGFFDLRAQSIYAHAKGRRLDDASAETGVRELRALQERLRAEHFGGPLGLEVVRWAHGVLDGLSVDDAGSDSDAACDADGTVLNV